MTQKWLRAAAALLLPEERGVHRKEVLNWLGPACADEDLRVVELALDKSRESLQLPVPWTAPDSHDQLRHPLDPESELPAADQAWLDPDLTQHPFDRGPPKNREELVEIWTRLGLDRSLGWQFRPSDKHLRDYSIWAHRSFAAALALAFAESTGEREVGILVVHLSPPEGAQAFIEQGRRTSELWARSFMLSFVTTEAMKAVAEQLSELALIQPTTLPGSSPLLDVRFGHGGRIEAAARVRASVPNHFFSVIPAKDIDRTANAVLAAVRRVLLAAWKAARDELHNAGCEIGGVDTGPQRAIATHVVGVPWRVEEETFATIIDRAHRLNAILRRSQDPPSAFDKNVAFTCTSCGSRRQLLAHKKQWADASCKLNRHHHGGSDPSSDRRSLFLPSGDALCESCLALRLAPKTHLADQIDLRWSEERDRRWLRFPSTASIASAPARARLLEDIAQSGDIQSAADRWTRELRKIHRHLSFTPPGNTVPALERRFEVLRRRHPSLNEILEEVLQFDGSWMDSQAYATDRALRDHDLEAGAEGLSSLLKQGLEAWLALQKQMLSFRPSEPWIISRYYAVLCLDGDQIGDWLSGHHKKMPKLGELCVAETEERARQPRAMTPALRVELSKRLSGLAGHDTHALPTHVESEPAFGRVIYCGGDDLLALLPASSALAAAENCRRAFSSPEGLGPRATATAGIAFAHSRMPMSEALAEARRATEEGKRAGRDRIHVHLLPRSGAPVRLGLRWRSADNTTWAWRDVLSPLAQEREPDKPSVPDSLVQALNHHRLILGRLERLMHDRRIDREASVPPEVEGLISELEVASKKSSKEQSSSSSWLTSYFRDPGAARAIERLGELLNDGESRAEALWGAALVARFLRRQHASLPEERRT